MSARVFALYRYAVKSMGGTELARVEVGPRGIPGDRGWALLETASGRAASAKRFPSLMLCSSRYVDEPSHGTPLPPAEITLPDGTTTRTDDAAANALLSRLLGADVALTRKLDGGGHFDDHPLHFLTTATLTTMRAQTGLDFDVRRFRPNVLIELEGPGRPEDGWPGATIRVGSITVSVIKPVKRCVMTTLPQPPLAHERGVLAEVLARGGALGVYGAAQVGGAWSVGDPVGSGPARAGETAPAC